MTEIEAAKVIKWEQIEEGDMPETFKGKWIEVSTGAMRYEHAVRELKGRGSLCFAVAFWVDVKVKGKWQCVGHWNKEEEAQKQAIRHLVRFNLHPEPTAHEKLEFMLEWPQEIWPDEWLKEQPESL